MRWFFALILGLSAGAFALAPTNAVAITDPRPVVTEPVVSTRGNEAEPVCDYTMRASVDPVAHTVSGTGLIRWRNRSHESTQELWVHLYLNAFKNSKSVFLREPMGGGRGSGGVRDWGQIDVTKFSLRTPAGLVDLWAGAELRRPGDEDETDVRVPLPAPVAPDGVIEIEMAWKDKLPSVVERTGYDGTFHMVAQWFPKIARLEPDGRWAHFPFYHFAEFYADFGTYDVTIDVPESFSIGATGPLVESRSEGGRRVEHHVQTSVHDFAFATWDQFQTMAETIDSVAVQVMYPPGYRVAAQRELATIRFALPHFSARYGAYPYATLTLVHPPETATEAGGMEYPTLITTGGPWHGPPGVHLAELVTMHEFGHQYFYGIIASDEVMWPFLDEGVNSYAEQLAFREWRGDGSAVSLLGLDVDSVAYYAREGNKVSQNTRVAQAANAFESARDYSGLVYSRSATILETLRRVYGEDPMARAMLDYTSTFRFRHPTADDFFGLLKKHLGADGEAQARAAFFEKAWVDYQVSNVTTSAADNGDHDCHVWVHRHGNLIFPVDVELHFADGTTTRTRWSGVEESTRLQYRAKSPLVSVSLDPDHRVLLDENLTNQFATVRSKSPAGAPLSFERAFYYVELILQWFAL